MRSIAVRSTIETRLPSASTSHTPRETEPFSDRVLLTQYPTMQYLSFCPSSETK